MGHFLLQRTDPGVELESLALAGGLFTISASWNAHISVPTDEGNEDCLWIAGGACAQEGKELTEAVSGDCSSY